MGGWTLLFLGDGKNRRCRPDSCILTLGDLFEYLGFNKPIDMALGGFRGEPQKHGGGGHSDSRVSKKCIEQSE